MKTKPKAKESIETITLEFLNETRPWPRSSILPLKKRNSSMLGVVFCNDKLVVYEANLFASREEIKASPTHKYDSFEAVVADGWIID